MAAEYGTKLRSTWAFPAGLQMAQRVLQYGDRDATEQTVWTAWWFAAAASGDALMVPIPLVPVPRQHFTPTWILG